MKKFVNFAKKYLTRFYSLYKIQMWAREELRSVSDEMQAGEGLWLAQNLDVGEGRAFAEVTIGKGVYYG